MEHNVYYDGAIQSIGFTSDRGEATIGVVTPGTYVMPTDYVERITILSGSGRVKIADKPWRAFDRGDEIVLPPNAHVQWEITSAADACYLCYFE